jgi:hypothetical protein
MSFVVWILVVVTSLGLSAGAGVWILGAILGRVGLEVDAPGLLRGGRWIGVLERLAITGGILAGHPEAIAIVIAVKGLGRYPELRGGTGEVTSRAAERFIVGTLASFLWAALIGIIGVAIAATVD